MSESLKRVLVAVVGIPLIIGSIYSGGAYFILVLTAIALLSQNEYYNLAKISGFRVDKILGMASGLLILLLIYLEGEEFILHFLLVATLLILIVEIFKKESSPLNSSAALIFGIIYPTLMIGTLYPLRNMGSSGAELGLNIVFALIAGVWVCDTAAYYIGKAVGKHKLLERVSPKKTWEGSIAGFIAALIFLTALKYYGFLPAIQSYEKVIAIAVIAGVGGQLGDLFESLLKRDAGVKDSGKFLPGHGGVLDRFDALIFAAPIAYIYLNIV